MTSDLARNGTGVRQTRLGKWRYKCSRAPLCTRRHRCARVGDWLREALDLVYSSHMAASTSPHWLDQIRQCRARGRSALCSPLVRIALSTSARELILADVRKWCEYWTLAGAPEGAAAAAAYIAESKAFRTLVRPSTRPYSVHPNQAHVAISTHRLAPAPDLGPTSRFPGAGLLHPAR